MDAVRVLEVVADDILWNSDKIPKTPLELKSLVDKATDAYFREAYHARNVAEFNKVALEECARLLMEFKTISTRDPRE